MPRPQPVRTERTRPALVRYGTGSLAEPLLQGATGTMGSNVRRGALPGGGPGRGQVNEFMRRFGGGLNKPGKVLELQHMLRHTGYNIATDGIYGAQTQRALEDYAANLTKAQQHDFMRNAPFLLRQPNAAEQVWQQVQQSVRPARGGPMPAGFHGEFGGGNQQIVPSSTAFNTTQALLAQKGEEQFINEQRLLDADRGVLPRSKDALRKLYWSQQKPTLAGFGVRMQDFVNAAKVVARQRHALKVDPFLIGLNQIAQGFINTPAGVVYSIEHPLAAAKGMYHQTGQMIHDPMHNLGNIALTASAVANLGASAVARTGAFAGALSRDEGVLAAARAAARNNAIQQARPRYLRNPLTGEVQEAQYAKAPIPRGVQKVVDRATGMTLRGTPEEVSGATATYGIGFLNSLEKQRRVLENMGIPAGRGRTNIQRYHSALHSHVEEIAPGAQLTDKQVIAEARKAGLDLTAHDTARNVLAGPERAGFGGKGVVKGRNGRFITKQQAAEDYVREVNNVRDALWSQRQQMTQFNMLQRRVFPTVVDRLRQPYIENRINIERPQQERMGRALYYNQNPGLQGKPIDPGKIVNAIDTANRLAQTFQLYLAPKYAINAVGQIVLAATQMGIKLPKRLLYDLPHINRHLDQLAKDRRDIVVGSGPSRVMSGDVVGGRVTQAVARAHAVAAGVWSAIIDKPWRQAAFYHEAFREGYNTPGKVHDLLTDPAKQADLIRIGRRSNREAIDYTRLGPRESTMMRRAWYFYPWYKGSSMYAGHYLMNHPVQAAIANQFGQYGQRQNVKWFGSEIPTYMEGLIHTGTRNVPGLGDLPLGSNVQSGTILGTPGQLLEMGLGSGAAGSEDLGQYATPFLAGTIAAAGKYDVSTGRKISGPGGILPMPGRFLHYGFTSGIPFLRSGIPNPAYWATGKGRPFLLKGTALNTANRYDLSKVLIPYTPKDIARMAIGGVAVPRPFNLQEARSRYRGQYLPTLSPAGQARAKGQYYLEDTLRAINDFNKQHGRPQLSQLPPSWTAGAQAWEGLQQAYDDEKSHVGGALRPVDRLAAVFKLMSRLGQIPNKSWNATLKGDKVVYPQVFLDAMEKLQRKQYPTDALNNLYEAKMGQAATALEKVYFEKNRGAMPSSVVSALQSRLGIKVSGP